MNTCRIEISRFAQKQIKRLPAHIRESLITWVSQITKSGIQAVRRLPGYHDEPLFGRMQGQRSARLSRAYRVIYVETEEEYVTLIAIQGVTKHVYR